jgi:4'-phosphopantetheinyl transferase
MPLLLENFTKNDTISALWTLEEPESFFVESTKLSNEDKKLLQNISSSKRRIEIVAARFLLNKIGLKHTIRYAKNGRPIISKGKISISHSDNLIGIIWHSKKNCGIDIEPVSNRIIRIAKRAFSETEIEMANNSAEMHTLFWCCKETIYKMANINGLNFKNNIKILKIEASGTVDCLIDYGNNKYPINLNTTKKLNNVITWCVTDYMSFKKQITI